MHNKTHCVEFAVPMILLAFVSKAENDGISVQTPRLVDGMNECPDPGRGKLRRTGRSARSSLRHNFCGDLSSLNGRMDEVR